MLALDLVGLSLSAGGLAMALHGRYRWLRALVAMVLGEIGRAVLTLALTGQLVSITAGGAFSVAEAPGFMAGAIEVPGLWLGAILSLGIGRRLAQDTVLYALLASIVILMRLGWEV